MLREPRSLSLKKIVLNATALDRAVIEVEGWGSGVDTSVHVGDGAAGTPDWVIPWPIEAMTSVGVKGGNAGCSAQWVTP